MSKHVVKYTHKDGKILKTPETWCGTEIKLFDFGFEDAQHLALSAEDNSLVQPCKKCVKAIIKVLECKL